MFQGEIGGSIFDSGGSIFDSTHSSESIFSTHTSSDPYLSKAAYLQDNNIGHTVNIRANHYENISVVDKMRGIQANRLNIDTDSVSLAESYADSSLDKRVMNGMYNKTITNIYKNKSDFEAYFGLYTDGKIDVKENAMLDFEYGIQKEENSDFLSVSVFANKEKNNSTFTRKTKVNATKNQSIIAQDFSKTSEFASVRKENESMYIDLTKEDSNKKTKKPKKEFDLYQRFTPTDSNKESQVQQNHNKFDLDNNSFDKESIHNIENQFDTESILKIDKKRNVIKLNDEEDSDISSLNKEESSDLSEIAAIFIGGMTGIYKSSSIELNEKELKAAKKSKQGSKGIYGEDLSKYEKDNNKDPIEEKILNILSRMDKFALYNFVEKLNQKEELSFKDKLKLKLAKQEIEKRKKIS